MAETDDYTLLRKDVDLRQYYLKEFGRGLADFNGTLVQPVLQAIQAPEAAGLAGWGCGILFMQNVLATLGREAEFGDLIGRSISAGAGYEGTSGKVIEKVLTGYGLKVEEVEIKEFEDVKNIVDKGGVVGAGVIAGDMGRTYESQPYGGHWGLVCGAGKNGTEKLAVMDSDLREGAGNANFGIYTLAWVDFWRINADYWVLDGEGHESKSEDYLWGTSRWVERRTVLEINRGVCK